jgi:hypothetical protein
MILGLVGWLPAIAARTVQLCVLSRGIHPLVVQLSSSNIPPACVTVAVATGCMALLEGRQQQH